MSDGANGFTWQESAAESRPLGVDALNEQILSGFILLADQVFTSGVENPIQQILAIGQELTGANILAVYQAQEYSPLLRLSQSLGPDHIFPDSLPAQELVFLNQPQLWITGKRPNSNLQRFARSAGLHSLASAPIGQPNAVIGLLVLAGEQTPDYNRSPKIAQLLAAATTAAIQKQVASAHAQMEKQTMQARLRVAGVLDEHTGEGVVLLSPGLKIFHLNTSAEMLLGYADREVAGQPVENILIGSETLYPALNAAQQGSITFNLGNIRLYRRNGEDFLAQIRVFPVTEGEKVEQILVFIQDLSVQEQIRLQAQQLEQRAILGELTAIFAHEVRNPINNISTGLQLMAMNLPEQDPNQASIERMLQDCDRLAELIKSVLSFSRPLDYEMESVNLGVLLRRLLERLHPRITRIGVQYQLHIEPGALSISGNTRALEQVFNNLVNNALQAMGETGGRLAIRVQAMQPENKRSYLEVSIADTGPGIPKEIQEKIFQPFFTTEQHGTGLGLAITKRIVTAHKGNIRLESFPGGTVFYVQFPAETLPSEDEL